MINFEGYTIPIFSVNNLCFSTIPCRAIIYSVIVNETDQDEGFGEIDIAFLLFSSMFDEPMILEKHFSNWPTESGIESALEGLITDDEVNGFMSLIGAVFDAEISLYTDKNSIYDDFNLTKVIALPKAAK